MYYTGVRLVAAQGSGSNNRRLTACVSAMSDGTKLPYFLIFRRKPHGRFELQLDNLLLQKMFVSSQKAKRMDSCWMKIWTENFCQTYMKKYGQSVLLPENLACHKFKALIDSLNRIGTSWELFSGGYIWILQPCLVGILWSFVWDIHQKYRNWAFKIYEGLDSSASLRILHRWDIISWASKVCNMIWSDFIRGIY